MFNFVLRPVFPINFLPFRTQFPRFNFSHFPCRCCSPQIFAFWIYNCIKANRTGRTFMCLFHHFWVATNSRLVYVSFLVVSVSKYRFLSRHEGRFVSYFLLDLNVDTWILFFFFRCILIGVLLGLFMVHMVRRMIIVRIKKKTTPKGFIFGSQILNYHLVLTSVYII